MKNIMLSTDETEIISLPIKTSSFLQVNYTYKESVVVCAHRYGILHTPRYEQTVNTIQKYRALNRTEQKIKHERTRIIFKNMYVSAWGPKYSI